MMINTKMVDTVRTVVALLAQGDFYSLEKLTGGNRLSAAGLAESIQQYGRTLVFPPETAFTDLDIIQIDGAMPRKWDVRMNLWTVEEGKSDLTLELTLTDSDKKLYEIEIDNIHVL